MLSSFDTPLRKGRGGQFPIQNSLYSSSSTCVLMKDQTYHVAGMDILTYNKHSPENETRRERYDPCCITYSPANSRFLSTSTRSFDVDILASSNRKRAQSDLLKSNSFSALKENSRKYNKSVDGQVKSSRQPRKYSTGATGKGPLIGTTVLVGCSSKDSFDCGSCSDETISSIETPGERSNYYRNTSVTNTINQNDDVETCMAENTIPIMWSSPYLMNLPNFFLGSRRRRSNILKSSRGAGTSCGNTQHQYYNCNVRQSSDFDSCAAATHTRKVPRRLVQLVMVLFMGIVLFSNNTSHHEMIRYKATESGTTTAEMRTVKNFSGAWGLTLSDPAEEEHHHELMDVTGNNNNNNDNNVFRRKRRPKLSQANSIYTQQLSSPLHSTTFVLTDDEIKQKTKAFDEHNHKFQYRNKFFHFAWAFLALAGIGMATFEILTKYSRTKLVARPVGTLNNRYSR